MAGEIKLDANRSTLDQLKERVDVNNGGLTAFMSSTDHRW